VPRRDRGRSRSDPLTGLGGVGRREKPIKPIRRDRAGPAAAEVPRRTGAPKVNGDNWQSGSGGESSGRAVNAGRGVEGLS